MVPVIDVHTHMLTHEWVKMLEENGKPHYTLQEVRGGLRAIHLDGAPFMTPVPPMFDWDLRVANMSKARVDIAVVSLTCPNVFWGGPEVSLHAARHMNDAFAEAQTAYSDRIRWFASLPWQHAELASPLDHVRNDHRYPERRGGTAARGRSVPGRRRLAGAPARRARLFAGHARRLRARHAPVSRLAEGTSRARAVPWRSCAYPG